MADDLTRLMERVNRVIAERDDLASELMSYQRDGGAYQVGYERAEALAAEKIDALRAALATAEAERDALAEQVRVHEDAGASTRADGAILDRSEAYRLVEEARQMQAERDDARAELSASRGVLEAIGECDWAGEMVVRDSTRSKATDPIKHQVLLIDLLRMVLGDPLLADQPPAHEEGGGR